MDLKEIVPLLADAKGTVEEICQKPLDELNCDNIFAVASKLIGIGMQLSSHTETKLMPANLPLGKGVVEPEHIAMISEMKSLLTIAEIHLGCSASNAQEKLAEEILLVIKKADTFIYG